VILSGRVVLQRQHYKVFLGSDTSSSKAAGAGDKTALLAATRAHANFAEYVPWAFVLAGAAELNGGDRRIITGSLGALLVARILHAELGIRAEGAMGNGRPLGWVITIGTMSFLGGYAAWLSKGFWGY
jgi:uncharacterized membrane protein YecN with MAPEG domain